MPFRAPHGPSVVTPPPRRAPPRILALAAAGAQLRLVTQTPDAVEVSTVRKHDGALLQHARIPFDTERPCVACAHGESWALFTAEGDRLTSFTVGASVRDPVRRFDALFERSALATLWIDEVPHLVHTGRDEIRIGARRVFLRDASLPMHAPRSWMLAPSSRAVRAAVNTVLGPVVLLATDRDDEIDATTVRGTEVVHSTLSLGRGQQFACATGGGSKVAVVSRGSDGLVLRTLARDLRSELNPSPIEPRTGFTIGRAHCGYASGPFVLAHEEHCDDRSDAVVTVFDGAHATSARFPFPAVDAMAVDGREITVAALRGGAAAPSLWLERLTLGREGDRGPLRIMERRRYAYLLGRPPCARAESRYGLLTDAAEVLALTVSARPPRRLALRERDAHGDVATFVIDGPDAARDITVGLLLRDDGSAVAAVRIGEGPAPEPRALNFVERVRTAVTGDDDGDAHTVHLEVPSLAAGLDAIVSSVWGLRVVGSLRPRVE